MGNINPLTWMSDNWNALATRELAQLCLPGCRAAGMSVLRDPSPNAAWNNTLTQVLGTCDLLCAGARFLDIHPVLHNGEWYAGFHSYVSGSYQGGYGEKLADMLDQVIQFLDNARDAVGQESNELVVLAFSHAFDMDQRTPPSSGDLDGLLGLVTGKLKGRMVLSNDPLRSQAQRILGDLLSRGNVLCLFADAQERLDATTGLFGLGVSLPRSGLPVAAVALGETITTVTAPVKATDTADGSFYRGVVSRRSLDGGRSWTQFTEISDIAIKAGTVPAMAMSGIGSGLLAFVGADDQISVLTTLDGGLTWTDAAKGKTGHKTTTAPAVALAGILIVLAHADSANGNMLTVTSRPRGNTGWSAPVAMNVRVADGTGPALGCNPVTGQLLLLYADADMDGAVFTRTGTVEGETINWAPPCATPGRAALTPSMAFMPDGSVGVVLVPDQVPAVPVYMSAPVGAAPWSPAGPVGGQSVDAPPTLIALDGVPLVFVPDKHARQIKFMPSPSGDGTTIQVESWNAAPVTLLRGTPQRAAGPAPEWSTVETQAHLVLYDARTTATDTLTVSGIQENHLLSYRHGYRELFCLSWVAGQSPLADGRPDSGANLLAEATSLNANLDYFITTRLKSGVIQAWNRPNILLVDYYANPNAPLDTSVLETALNLCTCTPDPTKWASYAVPAGVLSP